uniref:inositol-polyphosphate 5-phosphatase n=1 Tax=Cyprinodon variegatus TaxID=28743 RepID=A0A3Q2CMC2_CYPVA
IAIHCQELGGKSADTSASDVNSFVNELFYSDPMKEFTRARVYLDQNYSSPELYTALGSMYFIHDSLKNIRQFDFEAKQFRKLTGREICAEKLHSSPMVEREKFPKDYYPGSKFSRKGFIRTRWSLADCAFDLVNIHLFHDANNVVAWEESPSSYSGMRQKALRFVLDRITDQRYDKLPYFLFGDFNFRLDSRTLFDTLCSAATMQAVKDPNTNEVDRLIFRESGNDQKVSCLLFTDYNSPLLEFDKELSVFKDRLHELEISFPPSYPYSEDRHHGKQYMNTRCPAWCDRILMSPSAKDLVVKPENEEKSILYDNIGPNVCMGDHKPVFLSFRLPSRAGKPNENKRKCCVVQ